MAVILKGAPLRIIKGGLGWKENGPPRGGPFFLLLFASLDDFPYFGSPEMKTYSFGISTTLDYGVPIGEQVETLGKTGFRFLSLGAHPSHAGFLQPHVFQITLSLAAEHGLKIDSVHAPLGAEYDLASADPLIQEKTVTVFTHYCQLAESYGIDKVIIHPHDRFPGMPEDCFRRARIGLLHLAEKAPSGVKIAVENLPREDGSQIIGSILDDPALSNFGFCYDSSHENISGEPFHLLKKYAPRIITCHLSDNKGVHDDHLIPGEGTIDWLRLREHLDRHPDLTEILFEVGTGEPLNAPFAAVARKIMEQARIIFGINGDDGLYKQ